MPIEDNQETVTVVETKTEETPKLSLRENLEKNFKEIPDKAVTDYDGSPDAPAKGKSFVNSEVQETPVPAKEYIAPPADMSAEEKKDWESLSTTQQRYQVRRAQDLRTKMNEVYKKEQVYAEFDRVLTQDIRDEYAREKTTPAQAFENFVAWDKAFKTNKNATAIEYLKAQGINLDELVAGYQDGSLYKEPEPKYMTKEEFEREYEERRQKETQQQQELSIVNEREQALHSFLSNPLFQDSGTTEQRQLAIAREVRILQEIEGFQGSPKQVLDKALEKCIATNEHFTSARQSTQSPDAASTSVHEQMQRVRDAKKASRSISGSLGSGSPVTKASSLRESLINNAAKFGGIS